MSYEVVGNSEKPVVAGAVDSESTPLSIIAARALSADFNEKCSAAYAVEYKRQCIICIKYVNAEIVSSARTRSAKIGFNAKNLQVPQDLQTKTKNKDIINKLITFVRHTYSEFDIVETIGTCGTITVTLSW